MPITDAMIEAGCEARHTKRSWRKAVHDPGMVVWVGSHREAMRRILTAAIEVTPVAERLVVQPAADAAGGLTKAMEIVGNMRQSEAGLFDAKHSGQRGQDRSDALYDAYQAIRAVKEAK